MWGGGGREFVGRREYRRSSSVVRRSFLGMGILVRAVHSGPRTALISSVVGRFWSVGVLVRTADGAQRTAHCEPRILEKQANRRIYEQRMTNDECSNDGRRSTNDEKEGGIPCLGQLWLLGLVEQANGY